MSRPTRDRIDCYCFKPETLGVTAAIGSWNTGGNRTCQNWTEDAVQLLSFSPNPGSLPELPLLVLLDPCWQRRQQVTADPTYGPLTMEDGGAILSPLFLAVKSTPTFTSYFPSLGPGFFGCILRGLHNLGPVSLWRENTEDLVTRMRGGSEGIGRVRRCLLHLLYWDLRGDGEGRMFSLGQMMTGSTLGI